MFVLYRRGRRLFDPDTLRNLPTTSSALLLLLGYYLAYSAAVLIRGWRIREQPANPELAG